MRSLQICRSRTKKYLLQYDTCRDLAIEVSFAKTAGNLSLPLSAFSHSHADRHMFRRGQGLCSPYSRECWASAGIAESTAGAGTNTRSGVVLMPTFRQQRSVVSPAFHIVLGYPIHLRDACVSRCDAIRADRRKSLLLSAVPPDWFSYIAHIHAVGGTELIVIVAVALCFGEIC